MTEKIFCWAENWKYIEMACIKSINFLQKLRLCQSNVRLVSTGNNSTLLSKQTDEVTHTGQVVSIIFNLKWLRKHSNHLYTNTSKFLSLKVFDKDDYRNVRFQNSARIVNKNWGIKLIDETPITESTERVVSCNGGGGPLGHPKVYINLVSFIFIFFWS